MSKGIQEVAVFDSYDDPEIAYLEVTKALHYLSGQMNKGLIIAATGMEKMKTLDDLLNY